MKKQKNNIKDDFVITLLIATIIFAAIVLIAKYLGVIFVIFFIAVTIAISIWIAYKIIEKPNQTHAKTEEQLFKEAEESQEEINDYAGKYKAQELLTDHEMNFYRALKPIADNLGLSIISKVRMADLVKPTANYYRERSEYMSYFGKIKSKHVDFVLCDPDTLKVRLLIELEDRSHEANHVIDRDEFVENVYRNTGYKLLRTYTDWDLEKKIRDALGITDDVI